MKKIKMGRPPKLENRKDARFQVRLTEEDKEEFKKVAKELNMSTSEFLSYSAKKIIKEMREGK